MRTRLSIAALLAGSLLLGACGGGDDASTDVAATDTPTAGSTATPSEGTSSAELVSEDLPDGVAATVGDEEIPTEQLQARLEVIEQIPQVEAQLEGEQGDAFRAQLRTQTLTQLVLQEAVVQGAAAEDVQIADDQLAERRSELAEQAGGEEALAEQLATSAGVPEDQIDQELRFRLAAEAVTDKLLDEAGVEPTTTPTEGSTAPPAVNPEAQQVQQQWLDDLLSTTEIVVDEEYGGWDPASGQVVAA